MAAAVASPIPLLNDLPNLHLYILRLISNIQTNLYDGSFLSVVPKDLFKMKDFVFFLNGGYASSFYLPTILPVKDIDCSVLINPYLSLEIKQKIYFHLYMFIIHKMAIFIRSTSSFWLGIVNELEQKGIVFDDISTPQRLDIRNRGFTRNNLHPMTDLPGGLNALYDNEDTVLPPGCPFRISIQTDASFGTHGVNILLISLKLRTLKPVFSKSGRSSPVSLMNGSSSPTTQQDTSMYMYSYLDISISKPSTLTNEYDYDLAVLSNSLKHVSLNAFTRVPLIVANPIYLYINQLASSRTNSRPDKIASRKQRSRLLLDYIRNSYSRNTNDIKDFILTFSQWFYEHSNLQYMNDYRYYDYENIFHELIDLIQHPEKTNSYFARSVYTPPQGGGRKTFPKKVNKKTKKNKTKKRRF